MMPITDYLRLGLAALTPQNVEPWIRLMERCWVRTLEITDLTDATCLPASVTAEDIKQRNNIMHDAGKLIVLHAYVPHVPSALVNAGEFGTVKGVPSDPRYYAATTREGMGRVVQNLCGAIVEYQYDGVYLDGIDAVNSDDAKWVHDQIEEQLPGIIVGCATPSNTYILDAGYVRRGPTLDYGGGPAGSHDYEPEHWKTKWVDARIEMFEKKIKPRSPSTVLDFGWKHVAYGTQDEWDYCLSAITSTSGVCGWCGMETAMGPSDWRVRKIAASNITRTRAPA